MCQMVQINVTWVQIDAGINKINALVLKVCIACLDFTGLAKSARLFEIMYRFFDTELTITGLL